LGNEKSFSPLNSSYIMEAKKRFMSIDPTKLLDPPMPSYTFTIYNRDLFEKSKFKDYDSILESRLARCQARADYLASILENGNAHESKRAREKCIYDVKYGDGTITRGWIADDVITFVLDKNPVRILFGCGKDQMSGTHLSGSYSGIAGIGRRRMSGGYSLPTQFEADIMSLCLPGFYSGKGSTISFHTTPFKKKTSAELLPNFKFPIYYFVNLYKVFINDKEIPLNPSSLSTWNFGNDMTGGCMVDTGATITRFPQDFFSVFRDTFRKEVRDIPLIDIPLGFDTCYKDDPSGREPNFPVVKLYFGRENPENLLLLAQQRVMMHFAGMYCLGFIGWNQSLAILGANQLQGIGVEVRDIPMTETIVESFDTCYEVDPNGNNNDLHFPVVKLYFGNDILTLLIKMIPVSGTKFSVVKLYFDREKPENLLFLAQQRVVVHFAGMYCLGFIGWNQSLAILGATQAQSPLFGRGFEQLATVITLVALLAFDQE
ncbi:hypothetical protein HAX54_023675, partial [Datura stramonium]|nr:hypothetical protein [Datura stramonium]